MVSSVQVFKLFMGCLIEIIMSHDYKPSSFKHNLSGQFILLKIYKVAVVEHLVAAVELLVDAVELLVAVLVPVLGLVAVVVENLVAAVELLAAVLGHIPPVLELVDVVVEHFAEFED